MITRLKRSFAVVLLLAMVLPGVTMAAESAESWTGTLTAVSGTTVPATLSLQVDTTVYTVNVTEDTKIIRKFNGESSLVELAIGDMLDVRGSLTGTTIDATRIKNLSIQRKGGSFWGSVKSIDATNKTFVLDPTFPKKTLADQTVTTTAATKIFQGNRAGEFSDIAVGMRIKVIGLWRKSANTIAADRLIIQLTELNGTVKAIDTTSTPNTITVKSERKGGKDYVVAITSKTVIRDKKLGILSLADVKVGHKVHVRGLKTGALTLNALQIVDHGAKKTQKVFNGSIVSIDSVNKTFVLDLNKGGNVNVATKTETIYVNEDGTSIVFTDLMVGHDVQVRGPLTGTTITANLILDKDLPEDD
jgi:hypothetical protein